MESSPRISRHELFMKLAHDFSMRSTCSRAAVGCVIVVGKHPVAFGYNGAPPGLEHCLEVGCDLSLGGEAGCQRIVHAEANAVAHAARLGIQVSDGICYCTHSPCRKCSQLLATAGIKRIVYYHTYRATPWDLLDELEIGYAHLHKEK